MDDLTFSLPAPAKLNLFLNITGRRADGYHQLQTVFQLIDLSDTLHFSTANGGVELACNEPSLALADNLVLKAATLLQTSTGKRRGATIRLTKRIPWGAGLGGGSSDAAATLWGLNRLWRLGLTEAELQPLARSLGADVPVFLHGYSAWAEGIGDELQVIDLPEQWYLIINPGCGVSTARIFADPHLTRSNSPITIAHFLAQGAGNVCEPVVGRLYPPVASALDWLGRWGTARMTGTGCCVFLPFGSQSAADEVLAKVPAQWTAYVARGVSRSPMLEALETVAQDGAAGPSD